MAGIETVTLLQAKYVLLLLSYHRALQEEEFKARFESPQCGVKFRRGHLGSISKHPTAPLLIHLGPSVTFLQEDSLSCSPVLPEENLDLLLPGMTRRRKMPSRVVPGTLNLRRSS